MFVFLAITFSLLNYVKAECPGDFISTFSDPNLCYWFNTNATYFPHAEDYCTNLGGHLASFHDMLDNVYLSQQAAAKFGNNSNSDFWIGAIYGGGAWTGMDKTSFNFSDWAKGQPQISFNCGAMITNSGYWKSDDCSGSKPFVCLTNAMPDKCLPSWTKFNGTNKCYHVMKKPTYWSGAERTCVYQKSHLASIHSDEEMAFITELASATNECSWKAQTWIGLNKKASSNGTNWEWSDGSAFDYQKWAPNEPDNSGTKNTGSIWIGKPADDWAQNEFYSNDGGMIIDNLICEKEPQVL